MCHLQLTIFNISSDKLLHVRCKIKEETFFIGVMHVFNNVRRAWTSTKTLDILTNFHKVCKGILVFLSHAFLPARGSVKIRKLYKHVFIILEIEP